MWQQILKNCLSFLFSVESIRYWLENVQRKHNNWEIERGGRKMKILFLKIEVKVEEKREKEEKEGEREREKIGNRRKEKGIIQ